MKISASTISDYIINFLILFLILYLFKSGLGINISKEYHLQDMPMLMMKQVLEEI